MARKVWMRGRAAALHRFPGPVDVALAGARQPGIDRRGAALPNLSIRGSRPTVSAIC